MPGTRSQFGTVALSLLLTAAAAAQESRGVPRLLLDRKLQETPVQLTGVDERTVMFLDSAGQPRTETIEPFLAILTPADAARPAPRPSTVIELADGQRFVGSLATSRTPVADAVLWEHASLGVLQFKLDDVKRIQLQGGPELPPRRVGEDTADVVLLVNGDRIDGFVDSVGNTITIDVDGTKRDLPYERVQEVHLAGAAPAKPKAGVVVAWFQDGSVISCRAIRTTRTGDLVITPGLSETSEAPSEAPPPTMTLRLEDLWALEIQPGALQPLSSLQVGAQTPAPGRRWTRGVESIEPRWAALSLADVEIPGPMTVEWDLPAAATRFAADAELPRQMWTWGDCEVVVSAIGAGETELWRKRINAEAPRARVAVGLPVGAKRLRVKIDAGEFGSVQDKVILRRPVVGLTP